MAKNSIGILVFLFSILMVLSILAYIEENIAILVVSILYLVLGMLLSFISEKFEHIKNFIYIFLLFFLVYLLHSSIIHYGIIEVYGSPFIKSDELFFREVSDTISLKFKMGYTFFELDKIYIEGTAGIYLYGLVATLANFFGENSILVLKISVVLVSALIPMYLYGISRLYFSENISLSVATIYGFFSFVPYLSSTLLRDIHIALMFIITMYIILQRLSIVNLIVLFFVSFVSYYLRPQTGLFMMGFSVIYFFVLVRSMVENRYIELSIYSVLIGVMVIVVLNSNLMEVYNMTANSTGNKPSATQASGMGAKIAKLPIPLNIVAQLSYGQMQPFPPSWIFSGNNKGFFQISYLISGIAWFLGWGFLLYGLFKKKILSKVDLKLKLMFLISMAYLILIATIITGMRRQMPVYPILYLFMVFSYLEMSVTERTKIWVGMSLFYITLVLVINFLKI